MSRAPTPKNYAKDKRAAAFITTSSGRDVFPFAPTAASIDLGDIAHALANKCRWSGHTRVFFSVAQHSVLVSRYTSARPYLGDRRVEPRPSLPGRLPGLRVAKLWGLLHDAGEAYLPDIPSPIKAFCPDLVEAEERLLLAIAEAFDLPPEIPASVHAADMVVRSAEARDLMGLDVTQAPWNRYRPFGDGIVALDPPAAERLFFDEFYRLTRGKDS